MKIVAVAVALLMSVPAYAKPGTVYDKSCDKKEGYCSFSFIASEEQKAPGLFEVHVVWKTTRDDRTDKVYSINCRKRLYYDVNDSDQKPMSMNEVAYGGDFLPHIVDMRKAWKSVCKG